MIDTCFPSGEHYQFLVVRFRSDLLQVVKIENVTLSSINVSVVFALSLSLVASFTAL